MSKSTDISQQIRKYLNGELDARAMHHLEKEAQNDPFLMEALEGYEKADTGQQSNIDDIHTRLKARINKKEAWIIPWRIISIAASILIALTIGGIWLTEHQPTQKSKIITSIILPPVKKNPADTTHPKQTLVATLTPNEKPKAFVPPKANIPLTKAKSIANGEPNADINIDGPVGNADAKVAEFAPPARALKKDSIPPVLREIAPNTANALAGKVAGVMISKAKAKKVTGIVKDNTGPLPGVSVKIKGTNTVAVTDANGRFTLPSVADKTVLDLAYIGYQKKEVNIYKQDSLVIAMQPTNNSLNEVVVVGYGRQEEQEYQPARPAAGWDDYNKYLKDNAKSPDGKTGTVKLSFRVNTDNSLSDFKIIKSVSAKTDSAAIALVQDGPDWIRSTDNKPKKVKLKVEFKNGK